MYASSWNYYFTKLFSQFLTRGAFKVYLLLVKSTFIHKILMESNLQRTWKAVWEAICEKSIWLQDLKLANIPYHSLESLAVSRMLYRNTLIHWSYTSALVFFLSNRTVCQRQSEKDLFNHSYIATVHKLVKRGLTLQNAVTF